MCGTLILSEGFWECSLLFSMCENLSAKGTGADLPILSNEATANQWMHSGTLEYVLAGRPKYPKLLGRSSAIF